MTIPTSEQRDAADYSRPLKLKHRRADSFYHPENPRWGVRIRRADRGQARGHSGTNTAKSEPTAKVRVQS